MICIPDNDEYLCTILCSIEKCIALKLFRQLFSESIPSIKSIIKIIGIGIFYSLYLEVIGTRRSCHCNSEYHYTQNPVSSFKSDLRIRWILVFNAICKNGVGSLRNSYTRLQAYYQTRSLGWPQGQSVPRCCEQPVGTSSCQEFVRKGRKRARSMLRVEIAEWILASWIHVKVAVTSERISRVAPSSFGGLCCLCALT
jgi:hypothetical protein